MNELSKRPILEQTENIGEYTLIYSVAIGEDQRIAFDVKFKDLDVKNNDLLYIIAKNTALELFKLLSLYRGLDTELTITKTKLSETKDQLINALQEKRDLEKIKKTLDEYIRKFNTLENENKELKFENVELKKEIIEIKKDNDFLRKDNIIINKRLDELCQKNDTDEAIFGLSQYFVEFRELVSCELECSNWNMCSRKYKSNFSVILSFIKKYYDISKDDWDKLNNFVKKRNSLAHPSCSYQDAEKLLMFLPDEYKSSFEKIIKIVDKSNID